MHPIRYAIAGLAHIVLWAVACKAQTAPTSAEAFFHNASSFAVLSDSLDLGPGALVGFSFRTCAPGELLRQTGDGNDELTLHIDAQGRLVLGLIVDSRLSEAAVEGGSVLDGRWHTVLISVDEENGDLTLNASNGGGSAIMSGEVLDGLDLASTSPELRVGAGTVACFREGPGVRFTKRDVPVSSYAVDWLSFSETCLLPTTCSGMWTFLVMTSVCVATADALL